MINYNHTIYVNATDSTNFDNSDCKTVKDIIIILLIFSSLDIIFSFMLTTMLTKRLKLVLKIKMISKINNVYQKLQFLCFISILSSLVFILLSGLNSYIKPYKLFSIDLLINNASLILSFGKTSSFYEKFCRCEKHPELQSAKSMSASSPKSVELERTNKNQSSNSRDTHKTGKRSVLDIPRNELPEMTHVSDNSTTIADVLMDITSKSKSKHSLQDSICLFINQIQGNNSQNSSKEDNTQQSCTQSPTTDNKSHVITSHHLSLTEMENTETDKETEADIEKITPKLCSKHLMELGIII